MAKLTKIENVKDIRNELERKGYRNVEVTMWDISYKDDEGNRVTKPTRPHLRAILFRSEEPTAHIIEVEPLQYMPDGLPLTKFDPITLKENRCSFSTVQSYWHTIMAHDPY